MRTREYALCPFIETRATTRRKPTQKGQQMFDGKEYLTVQEAQEYCSCSRSSLDKARAKGLLHAVKGGFKLRYRKAELQDWIAGKLKAQAQTAATDTPDTESQAGNVPTQDGEQDTPQGETQADTASKENTDTGKRTDAETLNNTESPSAPNTQKPHEGEPLPTPTPDPDPVPAGCWITSDGERHWGRRHE